MTTTPTAVPRKYPSEELAERGWREESITLPDGTIEEIQVPLTEAEFLHPQEGYHLPNSTFHDRTIGDARDILTRRYSDRPDVAVFSDLLIKWNIPLNDHSPDICVVFGIQDKDRDRSEFHVATEGVLPRFILEVVSPRYRKVDRETKVVHYAHAQVEEYVIVDRRTYRGQILDEVIGYRLVSKHYQPITPDDEGRILCDTLGLWISLRNGQLVIEDAQTEERLPTSLELELRVEQAQQRAEQAQQQAEQERQRAERLAALLRSQGIDPDQVV
jgi:Uma2 family endonuclease